MKSANLNNLTYAVRLDPGDDIHVSLQDFCRRHHIQNASLEGIGSVEALTLAHYSIKTKQFTNKLLEGIFEITSLLGNVAMIDNEPSSHVHITVADSSMQVFGGHLVRGKCSATLEVIVTAFPSNVTKIHNHRIGLNVWDFDEH
ncbi:MAG TPA: PPC domain-containing DNA-binding protein [Candidatus Saccharimonadia bacterium]|nr:PPC domain-containing DNA-binding protein [Candidatus Saccharimonadia bacterium]